MTVQAAHVHVRQRKIGTYQIPLARAILLREVPASLQALLAAVVKDVLEEHVDFPMEIIAFMLSEARLH